MACASQWKLGTLRPDVNMSTSQSIEIVTIYSASQSKGGKSRLRILSLLSLLFAVVWLDTIDGYVTEAVGVPISILHWLDAFEQKDMDTWLGVTLGAALIDRAAGSMDDRPADLMSMLGMKSDPRLRRLTPEQKAERLAKANEMAQQSVILFATRDAWEWIARAAGGWLAFASLFGILGWRAPLHRWRQGYLLMGFSACAAAGGAWAMVRWGGAEQEMVEQIALGWLGMAGVLGLLFWNPVTLLRQSAGLMIFSAITSVVAIESAIRWGGMPPDADWRLYAEIAGIQSAYAWILLLATIRLR